MGDNAWSRILKNGVELTRVYEQSLLDLTKPTKWIIEVSTDGLIKVFSSHNVWMPLMTAVASPIDIKYLALASQSRIQFFYEVNEDFRPTMPAVHNPTEAGAHFKNPLFNAVDYPAGLADLCKKFRHSYATDLHNPTFFSFLVSVFEKYYKTIVSDPNVPSKYTKWIQLNGIEESQPNGYFLRFPFYLNGANDAHIVVSTKMNPSGLDTVYEFVIGGWREGHIVIRKGINGPVLADNYWPNALSVWRKKKFVLEIQRNNYIRLYSEDLPYYAIAAAYDWIPENVKFNYLSVKNIFGKQLSLSYGEPTKVVAGKSFKDLLTEKYGDVKIHPLFENWKKLQAVDLKCKFEDDIMSEYLNLSFDSNEYISIDFPNAALSQNGKYVESWEPSFKEFIPVGNTYKSEKYMLQFPVWIQATRDVRILFSSNASLDGGNFDIRESMPLKYKKIKFDMKNFISVANRSRRRR